MESHRFRLQMNRDQLRAYYAGNKPYIQCTTTQGRQLRFHASRIRPFVQSAGVSGEFVFYRDSEHQQWQIRQIAAVGDRQIRH